MTGNQLNSIRNFYSQFHRWRQDEGEERTLASDTSETEFNKRHDFCCFPWHLQRRWVRVMQPHDNFYYAIFQKMTNEIRLWGKFWPFSFNYFCCRQFFIFKIVCGFLFYFQSFVAAHRRFMNFFSLSLLLLLRL